MTENTKNGMTIDISHSSLKGQAKWFPVVTGDNQNKKGNN
jgi:hypothetical protein